MTEEGEPFDPYGVRPALRALEADSEKREQEIREFEEEIQSAYDAWAACDRNPDGTFAEPKLLPGPEHVVHYGHPLPVSWDPPNDPKGIVENLRDAMRRLKGPAGGPLRRPDSAQPYTSKAIKFEGSGDAIEAHRVKLQAELNKVFIPREMMAPIKHPAPEGREVADRNGYDVKNPRTWECECGTEFEQNWLGCWGPSRCRVCQSAIEVAEANRLRRPLVRLRHLLRRAYDTTTENQLAAALAAQSMFHAWAVWGMGSPIEPIVLVMSAVGLSIVALHVVSLLRGRNEDE